MARHDVECERLPVGFVEIGRDPAFEEIGEPPADQMRRIAALGRTRGREAHAPDEPVAHDRRINARHVGAAPGVEHRAHIVNRRREQPVSRRFAALPLVEEEHDDRERGDADPQPAARPP